MPAGQSESVLRRLAEGTATAAELEKVVGQSQASVSRLLRELVRRDSIVRIGSTRGARYALLRPIEGIGARWPLRRVGADGHIHELGTLHSLAGAGFYFHATSAHFKWGGVSDGLPYFLQDQRPAGFLGRTVPQRYPELALPQRVTDWSDDHYLRYLTQRGSDCVSDLILGDAALDEHLSTVRHRKPISTDERANRYPQLVAEVMEGVLPGSSVHGEHPKFAVMLAEGGVPRHVIVKYSPPVSTSVGRRWSDLLVAEHLAHEELLAANVSAARSRIHEFSGRTFLEVDRFDRKGRDGRVGVTSLYAIDSLLYGKVDNWTESATRLARDRRIEGETLDAVRLASTFGSLIANTDRHFGNLAFFDTYNGKFSLAPIYDMLPMLFAPEHDQTPARVFDPPSPATDSLRMYGRARALAEKYWRRCAQDDRISEDFKQISRGCLASIEELPRTGAYAATG